MADLIRVLMVENVADDAERVADILRQGGFDPHIRRVETERQLREALERDSWDVIFLDYVLPAFSGVKALKVCQESGCDAPIIVVSGSVGEEIAVEMMRAGADDYVMKDKLARLPAAVRRSISDAQVRRERRAAQEELKRSSAQLQLANEELHQFMHSVSHDLQEPLRMISVYADLIKRKLGRVDADLEEYLGFVINGAQRMSALLTDLRAYVEATNLSALPCEDADAEIVLQGVLVNCASAIDESGAAVVHDPLPKLPVRESHLTQLFQNLISNAIKYRGEAAPTIRIWAQRQGEQWRFACSDNGLGIAPEYRDHVFDFFKRFHDSKIPGTGMGLAICRRIVQRYGGQIWVESAPGGGSTFYFTLPASQSLRKQSAGFACPDVPDDDSIGRTNHA
ncbi:MAG TPA: ATP-binding protein [Bryobacteraceae bacterium]|jgi:signal transduction histidine kinase|nr:ATP-binding protein [Bryobacteraceae bacterium]